MKYRLLTTLVILCMICSHILSQETSAHKIKTDGEFEYSFLLFNKNIEGLYRGEYYKEKIDGEKTFIPHGKGTLSVLIVSNPSIKYYRYEEISIIWYEGKPTGKVDFSIDNFVVQGEFLNGEPIKCYVHYPNGNKYNGQFHNSLFDGYGKMDYKNGNLYIGEFKNGKYEGKGKLLFASGNSYEGNFLKGKYNGIGKFIYSENYYYQGEFLNSLKNGKGKLVSYNKTIYDGDFKEDKKNGKGVLVKENGGVFEGNFIDDKQDDYGKLISPNGNVYIGQFLDEKYHGKGSLKLSNGSIYDGEFFHGNFHGFGELKLSNGDIYIGQFSNGNFQGEGKILLTSKNSFEGNFKEGKYHGKGIYRFSGGDVFQGDFLDGFPLVGKLNYINNDVYEGCFYNKARNNQVKSYDDKINYAPDFYLNGLGKLLKIDGEQYEGNFLMNYYESQGVLWMKNGDIYEGNFSGGLFSGQGKLRFKSGNYYIGNFIDGNAQNGKLYFIDNRVFVGQIINGKPQGFGYFVIDGKVMNYWYYNEGVPVPDDKIGYFINPYQELIESGEIELKNSSLKTSEEIQEEITCNKHTKIYGNVKFKVPLKLKNFRLKRKQILCPICHPLTAEEVSLGVELLHYDTIEEKEEIHQIFQKASLNELNKRKKKNN
jgi:hypothetical protein